MLQRVGDPELSAPLMAPETRSNRSKSAREGERASMRATPARGRAGRAALGPRADMQVEPSACARDNVFECTAGAATRVLCTFQSDHLDIGDELARSEIGWTPAMVDPVQHDRRREPSASCECAPA